MTASETLTSIYGGLGLVQFEPATHDYYITYAGRVYHHPSVTTILKALGGKTDILMQWAADQAIDAMLNAALVAPIDYTGLVSHGAQARTAWVNARDEAGDIGKHVHATLEAILLGQPCPAEPDMRADMRKKAARAIAAGREFFAHHRIEVLEAEAIRWSRFFGFVGTGDLIARIDGKLAVLDYKTGKSALYPAYAAQTAAYAIAYEEEHPDQRIEERWIVRVGKFGGLDWDTRTAKHHAKDRDAFIAILNVWRWLETFHRNGYDGPLVAFAQ